jgi:hypothetical protein
MEARVAGVVAEDGVDGLLQVLIGLSGQTPVTVGVHEMVMNSPPTSKQQLHLNHCWYPVERGDTDTQDWDR